MEFLVPLSLTLAGLVGLVGVIVVLRRRQAEANVRKSAELEALDQRIASRIESLREGREATEIAPGPDWLDQPLPAIAPVETSLAARLRRRMGGGDEGGPNTVLRDTVAVLGVAVVLLFVATRFLPPATPPPEGTASPSPTELSVLPTGTPNLLKPTPIVTATPAETASPTPDITIEPTEEPTPRPTVYFPPPPGSTPAPTAKPGTSDTTPPSTPSSFGGSSLGPTTIFLDWNASSDNVGVAGYRIYRGGVIIATVTGTSYTDSGLTPATQYNYGIRAFDTSGNVSGQATTSLITPNPTPSPTSAPTATPTVAPTATPTPEPTPSPEPTL